MIRSARAFVAGSLLVALLLAAGCGSRSAVQDQDWLEQPHRPARFQLPRLTDAACPGQEKPRSQASFTLALPGLVDPQRAPLPQTEAERHVFGNCYETLVRIDCDGRLEPGLASTWQAHDGGRTWVFQLRDSARFWDGTPLGAVHVVESWRRAEELCHERAEPSPFLRFDPRGASLEFLGARELAIHLGAPSDQLPWLLAHPALAITGHHDDNGWPVGSGPLQPVPRPEPQRLDLVPVASHPLAPAWPHLELILGDDIDPRDLLDLGADALVTRQVDVVDYYSFRQGARLESLPWDLTYYLVTPTEDAGADEADRRRWTSGWEPLELAREVAAQTAEPAPFFSLDPLFAPCPVLPPAVPVLDQVSLRGLPVVASRDRDLVLWPRSDPDAGRLAERLAALAARPLRPAPERPGTGPLTPPPPPQPGVAPEAVAVPAEDLAAHVQAAHAGAIVLPWPHRWPLPCDELARLLSLADWLVEAGLTPGPDIRAVPPGATPARPIDDHEPPQALAIARRIERVQAVQPLLRTRAHLVRVPGIVGLSSSHTGVLHLWAGGWRDDPLDNHPAN